MCPMAVRIPVLMFLSSCAGDSPLTFNAVLVMGQNFWDHSGGLRLIGIRQAPVVAILLYFFIVTILEKTKFYSGYLIFF